MAKVRYEIARTEDQVQALADVVRGAEVEETDIAHVIEL